MSRHFELLDFLRSAPKGLLKSYFASRGLLRDVPWDALERREGVLIAQALETVPTDERNRVVADFRNIWDLHGRGFTKGILNEAQFHEDPAASQALHAETHLGKALWAILHRPEWAAKAKVLAEIDQLPDGAWIKRLGLPARPGLVDGATISQLEVGLIEFFTKKQHRGRHCKVVGLRQGETEIFFAYIEDHPDSESVWQSGQLEPLLFSRSFRLFFRHVDRQRSLDIFITDDRQIVPDLQQIFALTTSGEQIDREAPAAEPIYELDRLLDPGFRFEYSADLGITDVRITKIRFVVDGEPWRRFTAEADNLRDHDALKAFVSSLTAQLPPSRLRLDQVCIKVHFAKRQGDRLPPVRPLYITDPNSLRLKKDELGEKIVQMLVQSGIEQTAFEDEP